jgi:hypothetical protein
MTGNINLALLGAAILHVFEEYGYPGGFSQYLKRRVPDLAEYVTPGFAVTINALLLCTCIAGTTSLTTPILKLAVAALLGINGLMHIAGAIQIKGYVPGVVTSVLLYLPLSVTAFTAAVHTSSTPVVTVLQAIAAGIALQLVPVLTLVIAAAVDRR